MNHLRNNYVSWNGNGPTWSVSFSKATRPVKSYYEETVEIAELVWSEKKGDIFLCYSGGLDSEYVLSVFTSLGMNVKPVIMKTQYNYPETKYAFKYCEERNITPIVIDLDYDKFIHSGEFLEIATKTKCSAYQYISNMWLTSQIDGTVITGDSNPHMLLGKDGKWYINEIEPTYAQFEYFKQNNIYGTPFFLSYSMEQYLSFLVDPTIQKLANNEIPGKTGTHSSKVHVYNNQDKFKLEQRTKLTGYELVEKSEIFNHPDMQTVNSWKDKWWGSHDNEYHSFIESVLHKGNE